MREGGEDLRRGALVSRTDDLHALGHLPQDAFEEVPPGLAFASAYRHDDADAIGARKQRYHSATMPYGFVLVGGLSSRMGRDKTRLPYRGRPMALYQAEKLAIVCGHVAFVGKDPTTFAATSVPYVIDGAPESAAAFGVAAALAFSPEETNLVLAADGPRFARRAPAPSSRWEGPPFAPSTRRRTGRATRWPWRGSPGSRRRSGRPSGLRSAIRWRSTRWP